MTGTLPPRTSASASPTVPAGDAQRAPARVELASHARRAPAAVRPWSALVCGLPEDRTMLVVDWLLLACREAGLVAQAVPLAADASSPHGMYVEVAGSEDVEDALGELPWGAVDLLVVDEHLELMRAIEAGYVDPETTTVVASCRRSYTNVERAVAPQHVLGEREIDALARAVAHTYHAFDGPEVARWYHLPTAAQPGLLLGAVHGTGVTGLDADHFLRAIAELGIDTALYADAFGRGTRLGRRAGGRVRRVKTAYQYTRKRRALVGHRSRRGFEELVERAAQIVPPEDLDALQEAIYRLCEFQDSDWAAMLVDHVADIARIERESNAGRALPPHRSIVADAIRSLATMLVWPDAAWIANRKLRAGRLRELRTANGISRRDRYELIDVIPLDATERAATRSSRWSFGTPPRSVPPLLQPVRVERIRTTSVSGARRLRRMASSAKLRPGSARQRHELDTVETWLQTLHDALRADHDLARIVARSGTIVQGAGAVREANRATAHAFWGRIVRQSIAIDRSATADGSWAVSRRIVPFVWEQLCTSGPLALWEYAAQVLGIALASSRGMPYAETVELSTALCAPRRPVEGS